jgi:hypothetical protein
MINMNIATNGDDMAVTNEATAAMVAAGISETDKATLSSTQ